LSAASAKNLEIEDPTPTTAGDRWPWDERQPSNSEARDSWFAPCCVERRAWWMGKAEDTS